MITGLLFNFLKAGDSINHSDEAYTDDSNILDELLNEIRIICPREIDFSI